MAGEADAQQRLIEIHLADVAEIAKLYAGQGVLLSDTYFMFQQIVKYHLQLFTA